MRCEQMSVQKPKRNGAAVSHRLLSEVPRLHTLIATTELGQR